MIDAWYAHEKLTHVDIVLLALMCAIWPFVKKMNFRAVAMSFFKLPPVFSSAFDEREVLVVCLDFAGMLSLGLMQ